MKSYDSQIFFLLCLLHFTTMFISTLFPNMEGAQVRFGNHLTGGQWESWATWVLTLMSSLQIPSCGCLTPGLHQALYKNTISFLLPLLMPERPIQAMLALSRDRVPLQESHRRAHSGHCSRNVSQVLLSARRKPCITH